jgi:hypothetical protein
LAGFILGKFAVQLFIVSTLVWIGTVAKAQSFFQKPPVSLSIHNPSSIQGERNRTTISIVVPSDAGAELETVVLSQLPNLDLWDWGRRPPQVYKGSYALRGGVNDGNATSSLSNAGNELTIMLIPAVPPGEQVNIVFKSFNPNEGVYQWATRLIPGGSDALASEGPTLRLHVYRSDFIR